MQPRAEREDFSWKETVFGLEGKEWKGKYSELEFLNNLWGDINRVGKGLSYRPARLHSLVELVSWNRFLGFIKV
jgi:hypothetical protein